MRWPSSALWAVVPARLLHHRPYRRCLWSRNQACRLNRRQWLQSGWWVGVEFLRRPHPNPVGHSPARSLSLSGEPWPDYGQHGWDTDDEEIHSRPTTHFVATVDDLTDMLDFDSEDIDGMDDDVGDEHEPTPIGHWKATSSYDIYMVDTPKEGNGDETAEDDPSKKQPNAEVMTPL